MSGDLVPFPIEPTPARRGEAEPYRPPRGALSRGEREIYREGSRRRAEIELRGRLTDQAAQLDAGLTADGRRLVGRTVQETLAELRSIEDPDEKAIMQVFDEHLLQQHTAIQLGLIRTTMGKVDDLLSREFPTPPRRTVWERLLGTEDT